MNELIERLKREKKLKDQKVGFVQIEGLLNDAIQDIREAKKVCELGERAPFILAYQAMLKAGRALLFSEGLRSSDGAQHMTVIQVSEVFLGKPFKTLAQHFETMRRKRNELTYDYGGLLSRAEVTAALEDAKKWIHAVAAKVKEKNPQFELKFE